MTNDVRVVIADDEPLARRTLRGHLSVVDWIGDVHEAADGLTAIAVIDSVRPDLVFLDVRMPGASGIAVAEQIAHRPYIIFTTAYDRYAVTAFEIGALDYLLKPFGRDLLHARLHDLYARLDQSRFIRVHRSHIVNVDRIRALEPREGSRLTVVLESGTRIAASRAGSAQLRRMGK